jgi:hypothetical protein
MLSPTSTPNGRRRPFLRTQQAVVETALEQHPERRQDRLGRCRAMRAVFGRRRTRRTDRSKLSRASFSTALGLSSRGSSPRLTTIPRLRNRSRRRCAASLFPRFAALTYALLPFAAMVQRQESRHFRCVFRLFFFPSFSFFLFLLAPLQSSTTDTDSRFCCTGSFYLILNWVRFRLLPFPPLLRPSS